MRKRYYAIILMILTLGGCATTTHVYQVEVCLIGHEQEEGFYAFMQTVATTSHLVFKDGSERFERDMQEIEHIGDLSALPGETIYFGAESESGTGGFTAANIGLNPLQIAVGMSPTRDRSFDDRVINRTIDEISRRWTAHRVPASETFKPRSGCGEVARD